MSTPVTLAESQTEAAPASGTTREGDRQANADAESNGNSIGDWLQGLLSGLMSFIQPIIDAIKNFFGGNDNETSANGTSAAATGNGQANTQNTPDAATLEAARNAAPETTVSGGTQVAENGAPNAPLTLPAASGPLVGQG